MREISRNGFVLAGGKSSRMGTDKALLELNGMSLLDRALRTMREVCADVTIVGDPATLAQPGKVIADRYPGCGPLGGIHAALYQSSADLNVVLAVDMPFVSSRLLRFLADIAAGSEATVVVPRTLRGFQPLCAVYRTEFRTVAEKALRDGKYKIDALFGEGKARIVEPSELESAGFGERDFFNLNTPDDLQSARSGSIKS